MICKVWLPDFLVPNLHAPLIHPVFFCTQPYIPSERISGSECSTGPRGVSLKITKIGSFVPSNATETHSNSLRPDLPTRIATVFGPWIFTVRFGLQSKNMSRPYSQKNSYFSPCCRKSPSYDERIPFSPIPTALLSFVRRGYSYGPPICSVVETHTPNE